MRFCLVLALLFVSSVVLAAELPKMPVGLILEERYRDDELAVFDPGRLEFTCRNSPESPWGFTFAGFETEWKGPIELEVKGSGTYDVQDICSIAAFTLDYG